MKLERAFDHHDIRTIGEELLQQRNADRFLDPIAYLTRDDHCVFWGGLCERIVLTCRLSDGFPLREETASADPTKPRIRIFYHDRPTGQVLALKYHPA